jgi:hypothetical protein
MPGLVHPTRLLLPDQEVAALELGSGLLALNPLVLALKPRALLLTAERVVVALAPGALLLTAERVVVAPQLSVYVGHGSRS